MISNRAWVLLPSGRRLDFLNLDPQAWTDHDLSVGLSRTYRWAGYSAWDLPLSVAQHSLTVLAIREVSSGPGLTPPEALRELLDDAEEALLGGWDPLAAASEAFHVAGWSREAMRESLGITLEPLAEDPLPVPEGMRPWEPWPPNLAAYLFLTRMNALQAAFAQDRVASR